MKVLADECVPMRAVVVLRTARYDVRNIASSNEAGLDDNSVWRLAQTEGRLLVTSDRKFMRRRNERHFGIILVRLSQTNPTDYSRKVLDAICEVSPDRWPGLTIVVRNRVLTLHRGRSHGSGD